MAKYEIGDKVFLPGTCACTPRPPGGSKPYNDVKDCYHGTSTVRVAFRDGVSVWVQNRHGYARRFFNDALVAPSEAGEV